MSSRKSGTVTASITTRKIKLKKSLPSAIAVGDATRRSRVSVCPSISRTNACDRDDSAAKNSTTHSRALRMSVRSPSGPTAKLTAASEVTANSKAALSP